MELGAGKEYVFTIKWVVKDAIVLREGVESELESLNEMGTVEVINTEIREGSNV